MMESKGTGVAFAATSRGPHYPYHKMMTNITYKMIVYDGELEVLVQATECARQKAKPRYEFQIYSDS